MKPIFILVMLLCVVGCGNNHNTNGHLSYAPKWHNHMWACSKCGAPYYDCSQHSTMVDRSNGVFVLCEPCWKDLKTPDARMPYYRGSDDYNQQFGNQGEDR